MTPQGPCWPGHVLLTGTDGSSRNQQNLAHAPCRDTALVHGLDPSPARVASGVFQVWVWVSPHSFQSSLCSPVDSDFLCPQQWGHPAPACSPKSACSLQGPSPAMAPKAPPPPNCPSPTRLCPFPLWTLPYLGPPQAPPLSPRPLLHQALPLPPWPLPLVPPLPCGPSLRWTLPLDPPQPGLWGLPAPLQPLSRQQLKSSFQDALDQATALLGLHWVPRGPVHDPISQTGLKEARLWLLDLRTRPPGTQKLLSTLAESEPGGGRS